MQLTNRIRRLPSVAALEARLGRTELSRRLARGVFWTVSGILSWRLLSMVSTIVVARVLGPRDFGAFGLLQSTLQVFSAYSGTRIGSTATKYVAEYRASDPARAARVLWLSQRVAIVLAVIIAVAFLVSSPWLATYALKRTDLASALAICAVQMLFLNWLSATEAALGGFEEFRSIAKSNALQGIATPILCIPLTLFWGLHGALIGLAVAAAVTVAWSRTLLVRAIGRSALPAKPSWRECWREAAVLWRYSLPAAAIGAVVAGTTWTGRLFFVDTPEAYADLGRFEAANQWRALILFVPAAMTRVFLPLVSQVHGQSDGSETGSAIGMQLRAVRLIMLPLVILVISAAPLLAWLYGQKFVGTAEIIPVLMASVFLFGINQALRQALNGTGHAWANLWLHGVWAVAFVGSCVVLIPRFGALGLAAAFLAGELLHCTAQMLWVDANVARGSARSQLPGMLFGLLVIAAACLAQFIGGPAGYPILALLMVVSIVPILRHLGRG